jgi:hypothetical protein
MLKETNDNSDTGLQAQLIKHAQDLENSLIKEATLLSPVDKDKLDQGIIRILEKINNRTDFDQFMLMYFQNQKQLQKSEYQYSPYTMVCVASHIPLRKHFKFKLTKSAIHEYIAVSRSLLHRAPETSIWS